MKDQKDEDTLPYSGSQAALRRRSFAKTEFTLLHSDDNIGKSNEPINGRLAVGASLLDALYKHLEPMQFAAMPFSPEAKLHFAKDARARGAHGAYVPILGWGDLDGLQAGSVAFLPSPNIDEMSVLRAQRCAGDFSVVGLTHTLSTQRIYKMLHNLLVAPLYEWDALICTSQSAKRAVHEITKSHRAHYAERGITVPELRVQTPVIPLGIDCDRFVLTPARQDAAQAWRKAHNIGPNDILLLHFGRIDPFTKSHPLPLLLAMEKAQQRLHPSDTTLHLVMAGRPPTPAIADRLFKMVDAFQPSFEIHWIDGIKQEETMTSWHAADIFISLSDNVQETFGLTPIEAMAAGLPCVVSDWSGYSETIKHAQTGYLIPSTIAGHETTLGIRYGNKYDFDPENYGDYVGALAQCVSVDIDLCADAIVALATDSHKREAFGRAGSNHARAHYDWGAVLPKYLKLFEDLNQARHAAKAQGLASQPNRRCASPFSPDPIKVFQGFATSQLDAQTSLAVANDARLDIDFLLSEPLAAFVCSSLLSHDGLEELVDFIGSRGAVQFCDIKQHFATEEMPEVTASCLWLLKYGILKRPDPHDAIRCAS